MIANTAPEKLATIGLRAYDQGEITEAIQAFLDAAAGFLAAGEPLSAAEMKNNASVVLLQDGQAKAALDVVAGTPELFGEHGDVRRQAMAYGNQAAALQSLDQIEPAEELFQKAADLFNEIGEDELRASTLRALSELQLRTGRQLEAVATMHSGLAGLKKPGLKQRLVKKLLQTPFNFLNNQE